MNKLDIRLATMDDAEMLLRWRNDPETRANCFSTAEVSLDEHLKWLTASLANPDRRLFVALEENVPLGTVRADFSEKGCELSWTVAPEHRGRGCGSQIVKAVASTLHYPHMFARIKASNLASQKIASAAGLFCIIESPTAAALVSSCSTAK